MKTRMLIVVFVTGVYAFDSELHGQTPPFVSVAKAGDQVGTFFQKQEWILQVGPPGIGPPCRGCDRPLGRPTHPPKQGLEFDEQKRRLESAFDARDTALKFAPVHVWFGFNRVDRSPPSESLFIEWTTPIQPDSQRHRKPMNALETELQTDQQQRIDALPSLFGRPGRSWYLAGPTENDNQLPRIGKLEPQGVALLIRTPDEPQVESYLYLFNNGNEKLGSIYEIGPPGPGPPCAVCGRPR